jgi:hypothetical protein
MIFNITLLSSVSIQAYQHLGEVNIPKFTVIVAQKNHHTKLFQSGSPENVPPGLLFPDVLCTYDLLASSCLNRFSLSLQGLLWTLKLCTQGTMISTCVLMQG